MDIIVISDIHGDVENLLLYLDKIKEFKFDVIICPGDFTDVDVPKGFTQNDVAHLIIKELKTLKKPLLCVPGNVDPHEIINILEEEEVSIHGKGKVINGVGFYGFGGATTPFNTSIEPSEEELKVGLENSWKNVKDLGQLIQVTHNPPFNCKLDIVQSGIHVGSNVVKNFIESKTPIVAISSHIHEARGTDRLKNTFLMNSGKFSEGYFGIINIEKKIVNGKVLNLIE
jgi:Icc-related predicted phosphoesterase